MQCEQYRGKKSRGAPCAAEDKAEHTATPQSTRRTERHKDGEQIRARHNMYAQFSHPEAASGTSGPQRSVRHHRSKPRADRSRSTMGSDAGHQSRKRLRHRRSEAADVMTRAGKREDRPPASG